MPTAGGPNTLGESNLVFAYDTGDTGNSYKGQPTTNVEASNIDTTFETIADGNTAGFNNQLGTGNYLGVSSTIGYKSSKSLRINRGTGGTGRVYKTYSVLTGQYSSVSCWVYSTTAGPYLTLEYFGGDYSWGVGQTQNSHTGKGWELLYVRSTGPATSNTTGYYFLYPSIQNQDTYWDNIQVELKQYPTQFTTGTRSATQGLLQLIGTSTLDLTNMSFDSNAKMLFDGTNDYISIPTYTFGNGNWTLNMLINANDFANFNLMSNTSGGPVTNAFGAYSSKIFYYNYDGSWQSHSGNTTLSTGTWYMLTWVNYAGATANLGTMQMFVNGIADSSVFNSYTTNGGPCNAIGANWYSSFNGKIDVVQIYNKSLTAQEVKQNYQQYKTRFNLS